MNEAPCIPARVVVRISGDDPTFEVFGPYDDLAEAYAVADEIAGTNSESIVLPLTERKAAR